jgi:Na+/H+-translocating membrane pyrophosphatase
LITTLTSCLAQSKNVLSQYNTQLSTFLQSLSCTGLICTFVSDCITRVIAHFLPNKLCCFCLVAVQVSVPSVKVSETTRVQTHLATRVIVSALLLLVAVYWLAKILALLVDKATQFESVVDGALINHVRFALAASADHQINTLPAVVHKVVLNVKVTPLITTGSQSDGVVAIAKTALQAVWLLL